jgi:hypothetical protein
MSLDPNEVKIVASLVRQRHYYREHKIPALEKIFDAVKEMIGPQAGTLGPFECPPDTDQWLAAEYGTLALELGNLAYEVDNIEYRVKRITSVSLDEVELELAGEQDEGSS